MVHTQMRFLIWRYNAVEDEMFSGHCPSERARAGRSAAEALQRVDAASRSWQLTEAKF